MTCKQRNRRKLQDCDQCEENQFCKSKQSCSEPCSRCGKKLCPECQRYEHGELYDKMWCWKCCETVSKELNQQRRHRDYYERQQRRSQIQIQSINDSINYLIQTNKIKL